MKKENWQFVIKCETHCLVALHAPESKGVSWPGSKLMQCSTSLSSQPSSQQCMQRTQCRAHCSLYNTRWRLGISYEALHHSSSPFYYSIPPFHSIKCRHPLFAMFPGPFPPPDFDYTYSMQKNCKWSKTGGGGWPHTHEDIDQGFSCLSQHLRKHQAPTMPSMMVVVHGLATHSRAHTIILWYVRVWNGLGTRLGL